ncbi:MAG: glycosyltransferase family 2 protein [Candidatus Diapherotrites archaeon]|uniref:Glycosyltransferase family 2 protein n=1 Tax=Candidatus Iainarchaeum sp. TaxID=3101447 RepID=A0A939C645_9ARCH|nr:glycosyltransferase family 2 protein [Candidatus Diapherotrites archaeon]
MPAGKKLVVLIPAFNEQDTIAQVIKKIPRKVTGIAKVQVLVLDDGSTDATVKRAKAAGADKIVSHNTNKGLGIAFKTGLNSALEMGADITVNIDADGQFNPLDIPMLIDPILKNRADVVTCSRFKLKSLEPRMPFIKKFGNRLFTKIINLFTGSKFTDTQCGFRAYSREAALRANLFARFTYTQEVLIDLMQKGMRIEEVACRVKGQREGQSKVVKHWYGYGIRAAIIVLRTLRDYRPLQFFGSIGLFLFLLGGISAFILWARLLLIHKISPYTWVVYADVVLIVLGFLMMVLALIADMLDRQRKIQEETLYRLRKREAEGG